MTRRRLPGNPAIASPWRRGGGAGEPAAHPVPPPARAVTAAATSDPPLLIDSREVSRLLGIGRTKAFELMAREQLPVVRIGRSVRVSRKALEDWIAASVPESGESYERLRSSLHFGRRAN
jgi:excisionase family DNA binding protein